jgi:hypothetical protein
LTSPAARHPRPVAPRAFCKPRRSVRGGRRLALASCAITLCAATSCQTPARTDRRIKAAEITDIEGYIEVITRQRENETRSKVSPSDTRFAESIFEENLGLSLDGYAYHPNLVEYSLAGVFGLLQFDFERTANEQTFSNTADGDVLEFDLNARFFKKKEYPGSIYARRYEAIEGRPFLSSLRTTTDSYGLLWQYVSEKAPTSIQFDTTDVLIDPLSDDEESGRQENTTFRFETGYKFTDSNTLSLIYDRKSVQEEPFAFQYDSDELQLTHNLDFGDRKQHTLDSRLDAFDQRGTFNIERFRWREALEFRHTENFRTLLQSEFQDRTQGGITGVDPFNEESYYLAGTLEHELYGSLISQLFAWIQNQQFSTGPEIDHYGGQISFDYRKKNPWGKLLADYRVRVQREDRQGSRRDVEAFEERRTFTDPNPVILQVQNIQPGSIRITDVNRLTLYQSGSDYILTPFADRIEIERVPTGRIADGETVLVSYVFTLGSDFELDTFSQQFGIRQNFKLGLSPYYRLRWQDQTLSPPDAQGGIEDDITAHILGLEYRWEGLRLSAEYEDHDSTINPHSAVRLTGDYRHRFKTGATGSVRARWTDMNRRPPQERQTEFFTLEGRYRHPILKGMVAEGMVLYRHEEDSLSGDDDGLDLDLSLEWLIRQTELRVTFEYGQFEDDFAESNHTSLFFQLRRKF